MPHTLRIGKIEKKRTRQEGKWRAAEETSSDGNRPFVCVATRKFVFSPICLVVYKGNFGHKGFYINLSLRAVVSSQWPPGVATWFQGSGTMAAEEEGGSACSAASALCPLRARCHLFWCSNLSQVNNILCCLKLCVGNKKEKRRGSGRVGGRGVRGWGLSLCWKYLSVTFHSLSLAL